MLLLALPTLGCQGPEVRSLPEGADRAVREDARACAAGDLFACNNLGAAWEAGIGGQVDLTRARELFERSCAGGASLACVNLAAMLRTSDAPADRRRSLELLADACATSDRIACQRLADRLADPDEPEHDLHRAAAIWSTNCEAFIMESCVALGEYLLAADTDAHTLEGRETEARRLFTRACDAGHPLGCASLGHSLRSAEHLERDPARGFALLERTCFGGDPRACERALRPGHDGIGTDRVEALRNHACAAGVAAACAQIESPAIEEDGQ